MDDRAADSRQSQSQDRVQSERRLARGLEELSSLFLSQAVRESVVPGETGGNLHVQAPAERATPAVALRPLPDVGREQVASLLKDNPALLEENLRIIDANIPVVSSGPIDLLGMDGGGRLAIVDLDTSTNGNLLMRGMYHFDWLVRNVPILRRMYRELSIDYAAYPRLFLVAPDYSVLHRSATHWISIPRIKCFRYHPVAMRGAMGILVEPA